MTPLLLCLLLTGGQSLADQVSRWAGELASDSPEQRELAGREIVRLGWRAVPLLESASEGKGPEVRERLQAALARIIVEDPVFLFRSSGRKISVSLSNVPAQEAHAALAGRYPMAPRWEEARTGGPGKELSLVLDKATYWEAFLELLRKAELHADLHDEGPGARIRTGTKAAFSLGAPAAELLPTARLWRDASSGKSVLDVRLLFEPGFRPVAVTLASVAFRNERGEIVEALSHRGPDVRSPEGATAMRFEAGELGGRMRTLRIQGKAALKVPVEVHSVEARIADLKDSKVLVLDGCRIVVERFLREGSSVTYRMSSPGVGAWSGEGTPEYRGGFWVFLADEEGRSQCHSWNASTAPSSGTNAFTWPYSSEPSRLRIVRVMHCEDLEIAFRIVDVPLPG